MRILVAVMDRKAPHLKPFQTLSFLWPCTALIAHQEEVVPEVAKGLKKGDPDNVKKLGSGGEVPDVGGSGGGSGGVVQEDVKKMAMLALMVIAAGDKDQFGSHLAHKVLSPSLFLSRSPSLLLSLSLSLSLARARCLSFSRPISQTRCTSLISNLFKKDYLSVVPWGWG